MVSAGDTQLEEQGIALDIAESSGMNITFLVPISFFYGRGGGGCESASKPPQGPPKADVNPGQYVGRDELIVEIRWIVSCFMVANQFFQFYLSLETGYCPTVNPRLAQVLRFHVLVKRSCSRRMGPELFGFSPLEKAAIYSFIY